MTRENQALTNLVVALEQATQMAKQLPNTTDPSQILQTFSTLHVAHHRLTSFLYQTAQKPPQPSLLLPPQPLAAAENSVSDDEAMQVGDGDEEIDTEQNSKIAAVENKRSKRPLSPSSAAADERRRRQCEFVRGAAAAAEDFDPQGTRLRTSDV